MKLRCNLRNAQAGGTSFLSSALVLMAAAVVCTLAASSVLLAGKKRPTPPRTVMGIVSDPSDNPIVGAVVEMTNVQTGKKVAMYTQQGGHYQFSGLNADQDYKIRATYKGVASEVRTASSFDTRNTIRLNLQIPPPKDEDQ